MMPMKDKDFYKNNAPCCIPREKENRSPFP